MENFAIIGMSMLVLILMLFQHVINWMFRTKEAVSTFAAVCLSVLSFAGMWLLITQAIKIW